MDNKKIGGVLIILSLIVGGVVFSIAGNLDAKSQNNVCNPTQECQEIATGLGMSHIGIGALGAILALGLYLIFFNKSEEAILQRLEAEKEKSVAKERLAIMLQTLDDNEKKILSTIVEQTGITQNLISIRTGLSKAKVSQVLSAFERKNMIKREVKGRTYSVYLAKPV